MKADQNLQEMDGILLPEYWKNQTNSIWVCKETGKHKILLILHVDIQVSIFQSLSHNTKNALVEKGNGALSYRQKSMGRSKEAVKQASLMLCFLGALKPGSQPSAGIEGSIKLCPSTHFLWVPSPYACLSWEIKVCDSYIWNTYLAMYVCMYICTFLHGVVELCCSSRRC